MREDEPAHTSATHAETNVAPSSRLSRVPHARSESRPFLSSVVFPFGPWSPPADLLLLVNSGRPQSAVTADLVEFFGEQHAESLGAFLTKLNRDYVLAQQQKQQQSQQPPSESKKVSLKRTRDEPAPKSPAIAPSAAPAAASSSSSSRKPDQARFVPGSKLASTPQPQSQQQRELIVGGGRVQRGRGLGSAIVVHRKQDDDSATPPSTEETDAARPSKARRSGQHDAPSSESTPAPKFQITFNAANGGGRHPAPVVEPPATAKPKRLLITKKGQAVHPAAVDLAQTNLKITRRGQAAAEVLETTGQAAAPAAKGQARRSFGGGFDANGEAMQQAGQEQLQPPQPPMTTKVLRVQRAPRVEAASEVTAPAAPAAKQPPRVVQKRAPLLPTPVAPSQDDMADEETYQEYDHNGQQQFQQQQQQPPSAFTNGYSAFANQQQQQSAFTNQQQQQSAFTQQFQQPSAFHAAAAAPSAYQPTANLNPNASKTKCRFFPQCTNLACPFLHPTQLCAYFPNCTAGDACPNLHPAAAVPCRFGDHCTNSACTFSHVGGASAFGRGGRGGGLGVRGRGGRGGSTGRAGLQPVEGIIQRGSAYDAPMRGGAAARGRGGLTNMLKLANTPCRYGAACTRGDCIYSHPGGVKANGEIGSSTLDIAAPFAASAFTQPQPTATPKSVMEIAAQMMQRQQHQQA